MKIVSGLFSGYLSISKVFPDGSSEKIFSEEKNLITNDAKHDILEFLVTPGKVSDVINLFKVGVGGTYDVEGQYPRVLTGTETDLFSPIFGSNNLAWEFDETGTRLVFSFDVLDSEGVGQLISEVGLFKESGEMFNIKTFPSISKGSGFSLRFQWVIKYG